VCGTGTINALGVVSLVLNLPTFLSTFYIYAMITESPSGIGSLLLYNYQFNISNFTTSYATIQTFAKSNTSSMADFSNDFKNVLLGNLDSGTTLQRFHGAYTNTSIPIFAGINLAIPQIPSWQTSVTSGATHTINIKTSLPSTNTAGLTPFGSGVPGSDLVSPSISYSEISQYHCRYYWDFKASRILTSIILYTSYPGWNTEWAKMEIVGSDDGVNFIRIPTEWSVTGVSAGANTVEDVFHVKYNRRSKGGSYAWLFADNFATVSTVTASQNISSSWHMLTTSSSRPMICTINLVNSTAYRYYGWGSVGSGTPFVSSASRDPVYPGLYYRGYARNPHSHSYFCDHKQNGVRGGVAGAVLPEEMMSVVMPWIVNQGYVNYMIPQVLPSNVISTPIITYKYWRFRATSGFLGAFGNAIKVWFWKLGLFRDITTANEDTYGTYSTNYIQQWANSLYNNSSIETTKGTIGRDALFCSVQDWTTTSHLQYTYSNVPANEVTCVTFTNESSYMTIKLDVTGTIGALRFPSAMYTVRGGAYILEVSNTGAAGSWTTMVATCGTATLGREGIISIADGGATGISLTNKLFSITPATNLYSWPTSLDIPVITGGTLVYNTTSACTIRIIGGNTITNTKDDFNVHLVSSDTAPPYWTPGTTIFNCKVTSYNPQTSILSFDSNTSILGDAFFVVFIRSGEGTGLLGTIANPNAGILISKTFSITNTQLPRIWLDGSDPKYTALTLNTASANENIEKWIDKIGTSNCEPQTAGVQVFTYKPTGVTGINKGCMYMPGNPATNGISQLALIPYPGGLSYMSVKYTFSILCKGTVNGSNVAAAFISSLDTQLDGYGALLGSFFMGIYNNTLQNYTHTFNNWGTSHVTNASNNPININNTWVHLVFAFDESTATSNMYMNGVMLKSSNHGRGNYWNQPEDGGTAHIAIGAARDGKYGANMYIADIQIYDFALKEPAVKVLSKNLATKFGVTLNTP
jgi:hypothetical protein